MAENAGSVKAAWDGFCQMSEVYDERSRRAGGRDLGTDDRRAAA
jgi:hypothetical protein